MLKKHNKALFIKNSKLLPDYVEFKPCYPKPLKMIFSAATPDVIFVLDHMLQLNPLKRTTCREVR